MRSLRTTETAIVKSCLQWLWAHGIFAYRQNQGALKGTYKGKKYFVRFAGAEGISDIIGICPKTGTYFAIEVKQPGEEPTEEQKRFLWRVQAARGESWCVHSVAELETIGKRMGWTN